MIGKIQDKYLWTNHVRDKMRYYRLAESRIKRIIRHPARVEEGILEGAVACMQPAGGKNYSEIWTMYLVVPQSSYIGSMLLQPDSSAPAADSLRVGRNFSPLKAGKPSKFRPPLLQKHTASTAFDSTPGLKQIKVITAWRYPGKSPEREPIPADVLREVRKLIYG